MRVARIVLLVIAAIALGVLLAAVAEFVFFVGRGSWLNLVEWAAVGIVIGMVTGTWARSLWVAALVGFTIVLSYSILGYQGSAPLAGVVAPFAGIALGGALGMAAAGAAGHALRRLWLRRRRPSNPDR